MKYKIKAAILAVVLAFLVPKAVFAEDYISKAIEALQSTSVYVYPGTKDTDNDTAGKLQTVLRSEDNIVLVMLPAEAETGTDIFTIVKSLSEKLGNQHIIGLAVGKKVAGFAPMLDSGVAADQMRRADSVSNDPVTALGTFAQNIHLWQASHPKPKPIPTLKPTPTPKPTLSPAQIKIRRTVNTSIVWFLVGVILAAAVITFIRIRKDTARTKRLRLFRPTENLIWNLQGIVTKISDRRVRDDIMNACEIALGLLEILRQAKKPQGYVEEKFPELVENMDRQTRAYIGHESGRLPISPSTLEKLRVVLLGYDDLFTKLQDGNPEATDLVASIIDSNNTMIQALGYMPDENQRN